jgi:hypothetical protein
LVADSVGPAALVEEYLGYTLPALPAAFGYFERQDFDTTPPEHLQFCCRLILRFYLGREDPLPGKMVDFLVAQFTLRPNEEMTAEELDDENGPGAVLIRQWLAEFTEPADGWALVRRQNRHGFDINKAVHRL